MMYYNECQIVIIAYDILGGFIMPKSLLTTTDLMNKYKVARSTIDRWRKDGMPFIKIGRGIRFDEDEVQKWIENNK